MEKGMIVSFTRLVSQLCQTTTYYIHTCVRAHMQNKHAHKETRRETDREGENLGSYAVCLHKDRTSNSICAHIDIGTHGLCVSAAAALALCLHWLVPLHCMYLGLTAS